MWPKALWSKDVNCGKFAAVATSRPQFVVTQFFVSWGPRNTVWILRHQTIGRLRAITTRTTIDTEAGYRPGKRYGRWSAAYSALSATAQSTRVARRSGSQIATG